MDTGPQAGGATLIGRGLIWGGSAISSAVFEELLI